jgi:hypothetical protein
MVGGYISDVHGNDFLSQTPPATTRRGHWAAAPSPGALTGSCQRDIKAAEALAGG